MDFKISNMVSQLLLVRASVHFLDFQDQLQSFGGGV
jgi:hypothetical protein